MNLQQGSELTKENGLTFMHYKEPLKEIPQGIGVGYYGAVLITPDGEKMQCHVCGQLFGDVGTHARQKHKITHDAYRERYELANDTALISEVIRQNRKKAYLTWLASLSPERREALHKANVERLRALSKKYGAHGKTHRLETKNKRGTCPDQLIAKILEVANELGHTPSKNEFIAACKSQRYAHLIYKTFGSWGKALKRAGLEQKKRDNGLGVKKARYTNDELLDALSLYWQEEGVIPTETDARRGLIPATAIYQRRFGSLPLARELAGIRDVPSRWA